MTSIPTSWKNCATCTHWTGYVVPNVFGTYVEFDNSERAKCINGGFRNCPMSGMQTCNQWEGRWV